MLIVIKDLLSSGALEAEDPLPRGWIASKA